MLTAKAAAERCCAALGGFRLIHSFLLIGQSNMAGRGFLNEAVDVDNSHIKILRNGRWQKMFRPINPDRSFSGVSLAESFAEAYAKTYDVDVGLICCADGGTTLAQWQPGSLLLDNAISQAKLAQRTSVIVGILWHQGEGEAQTSELANSYPERFCPIVEELRKELELPDVPFLVGGLGDFLSLYTVQVNGVAKPHALYGALVNTALESFAAAQPYMGFVPATGLTANPDNLHFNAKSLYEFGLRYFAAYQKLVDPDRVIAAEVSVDDTKRSAMEAL